MADLQRAESRLLPVLSIIAFVGLVYILPSRYALLPQAVTYILAGALIVALTAAGLTQPGSVWIRVERLVIAVFVLSGSVAVLVTLKDLIADIVFHKREISAITLLTTSVGLWVANVLIFALAYWQLDRGGPDGRARGWTGRADLTFSHGDPSDDVPADWRPSFADYLFLAFNTSTAFSPTDTLPLTVRAKMLMMAQSSISLVTIVIVAARAINVLG
jgi:hypothetical protein